ncbi:unnamed protein product [Mycena citricolor]|uniref:Uncharacterized protein n=1 Tax=Mycena citricolor TaxID=2018698 RepID=A0AAD2HVG3_9AGAR|nr:unnamed protein product [Mycena citricolor]
MDADKVRPVFLCFVLLRILLAALCFLLFWSIYFFPPSPAARDAGSLFSFVFWIAGSPTVLGGLAAAAGAKVVPVLQPGFFFDYTPPPVAAYTDHAKSITPFTIDAGNGLSFDWQFHLVRELRCVRWLRRDKNPRI